MTAKNVSIDVIKKAVFWYIKEHGHFMLPVVIANIILCRLISRLFRNKEYQFEYKKIRPILLFTGNFYTGNSRVVYEKMSTMKDYNCIWIARNLKDFRKLRKSKKGVIYLYFPYPDIKKILGADVIVTKDSFLSFLFAKKPIMIQLWHGVGPKGIPPTDFSICDARCVTSEYTKRRHIELWNEPPDKLFVTGFARMDLLVNYLKIENVLKEDFCKRYQLKYRKILLYAPTWEVKIWPWGDPYKELERLCSFCESNKVSVVFRPHPLVKIPKRIKNLSKVYNNFIIIDRIKEPDTMKLLAIADILVTDWSSIYTDFFLTKRPIIYLEVDRDYFTRERGKPEIPPEFRAGEIAHNSEEFYKALKIVLEKGNRFEKEQDRLLKLIHGNVDGKATERVIKVTERLLEEKLHEEKNLYRSLESEDNSE